MDGIDADVAVVGYGPIGVSAANLLGRYGVRTVVCERDKGIYPRARAVTVNDWTMRIFQSMGLDEQLKADMDVTGTLTWKTYSGKTIFRLRPGDSGMGHAAAHMIYQPAMEETLRAGVERYPDTVDVHCGQTATALEQDPWGATVSFDTGERIRVRYVLACDGGSSSMRTQIGAHLVGTTHEVTWIVIDAKVLQSWPGHDELTFWSDPDRPAVDIPLALGNHRWELPLHAGENPGDFDSEEAVWGLLRPLGVTSTHVQVKQHAFYSHHVRHADRWRVGRVFLLGDAAHLMPPWAGQGMQSGIRDAANLTWKLREVVAGRIAPEVLDTYQPERAPHVAACTDESEKLGTLIAAQNPAFVRVRNALGPMLMHVPWITRKLMPAELPTLSEGWLSHQPRKREAVGTMVPQVPLKDSSSRPVMLDEILGDGFAVLTLDEHPRNLVTSAALAEWERLGARFVTVQSRGARTSSSTGFLDHTGELGRWLRKRRTRVIGVRPDRFIAASEQFGAAPPTSSTASRSEPDPSGSSDAMYSTESQ